MADFCMPSLGADMASGILVEWKIAPGDAVTRGQVVAVVETDKGAIDIECFVPGVVEALLVPVGTGVPVGTPLARLRGVAEDAAPLPAPHPVAAPAATAAPVASASADDRLRLTPRARRRAQELGVDPSTLHGTGPHGSVTTQDIEAAAAAVASPPSRGDAVSRGDAMQKVIAAAMARSKREIPHYYLVHTIDLEPLLLRLEARNAAVPPPQRVLAVAPLLRAVALALSDHRELCGWWRDDAFVPSPAIHVGLAVSLRDGGLVNPAIRDADQGDLTALMAKIRDVTQRARHGGLRASEFADAAITVTNMGEQGVDAVWGVIHPPQVAIVGFGAITPRPWVVDGQVVVRRVVDVTLAADHRTSNGHRGARFLRRVAQLLEREENDHG